MDILTPKSFIDICIRVAVSISKFQNLESLAMNLQPKTTRTTKKKKEKWKRGEEKKGRKKTKTKLSAENSFL